MLWGAYGAPSKTDKKGLTHFRKLQEFLWRAHQWPPLFPGTQSLWLCPDHLQCITFKMMCPVFLCYSFSGAPERKNTTLAWFWPPNGFALNRTGVVTVPPLPLHVFTLVIVRCTRGNQTTWLWLRFDLIWFTWWSVLVLHQGLPLLST